MSTARQKAEDGMIEAILDEAVSAAEMDQTLAGRMDEVNAKLGAARRERERGEFAPLEPLHIVLKAGRERIQRRNRR